MLLSWARRIQNKVHFLPSEPAHVRHVIQPSMYQIVEDTETEPEKGGLYYEFILDGKSYTFSYDEAYIHDGNLYFCTEHNALE